MNCKINSFAILHKKQLRKLEYLAAVESAASLRYITNLVAITETTICFLTCKWNSTNEQNHKIAL